MSWSPALVTTGVTGTSILELQAQLYRTQEHTRGRKDGPLDPLDSARRTGLSVAELMKGRNAGVEERDKKDKLSIKVGARRGGHWPRAGWVSVCNDMDMNGNRPSLALADDGRPDGGVPSGTGKEGAAVCQAW
jgi:hypothetical protein